MKTIKIIKIFIALFFLLCTQVLAKEINFEATVDRNKIGLGQSLQLGLVFDGSQNMPVLELLTIEGFQARYLGPSTKMTIINGQASSSVTYVYTLLPAKVGVFKIGPFRFEHNGDTYNSNTINVEVLETAASAGNQPFQEAPPQAKDLNERIFLKMQLKKEYLRKCSTNP